MFRVLRDPSQWRLQERQGALVPSLELACFRPHLSFIHRDKVDLITVF